MKFHVTILTVSAFIFLPQPCSTSQKVTDVFSEEFIVWNVGQGLWTTWIRRDTCFHFDLGGEKAPWKEINRRCSGKKNKISLSHWDWDHIRFLKDARKSWPDACVLIRPVTETSDRKKRSLLKDFPSCHERNEEFEEIGFQRKTQSSSNDSSRVFALKIRETEMENFGFLLPGDSGGRTEKIWSRRLGKTAEQIRVLVLGHHGSRTSTSMELLSRLPVTRQGVASARRQKYGHAHRDVVRRLRYRGVALIQTEDWGSIRWQRPVEDTGAALKNK